MAFLLAIARIIGIISPTIYASITFSYSNITIQPLLTHAPPILLAKQWLQCYQMGPRFVPPLIISGTLSNAMLGYFAPTSTSRTLYILAAVATWSVLPCTMLYMEPGINGAAKWKALLILKGEGYTMEENGKKIPSVYKHTATPAARRWAERMEMKDIVRRWGDVNSLRWYITGFAAVVSGIASHVEI